MKPVTARVWPHNHTSEFGGPLDVKIGITSQPEALQGWNSKNHPLFNLEQPQEKESNFTILRVLFHVSGPKPEGFYKQSKWHKANVWGLQELSTPPDSSEAWIGLDDEGLKIAKGVWKKAKPSHLTVYLKARYVDALPHPVPLGKWEGTVDEGDRGRWVLFTLQAMTLAVQKVEEKRHILIPGDPGYDTPPNYSRIVRSVDGVEGR